MLALTLVLLSVSGGIGAPRGVHLLDDAPLLAQLEPPPLLPSTAPATDAEVSSQQLQVDLEALKKQRPGLGGGIALVSAGGGVAILGALYLAISRIAFFGAGLNPFVIVGIVGLGIGLPLVAIGVWLLYNRLEERKRIDDEMGQIKQQLKQRQLQRPSSPPPSPLDLPPPQVRAPDASMLIARF